MGRQEWAGPVEHDPEHRSTITCPGITCFRERKKVGKLWAKSKKNRLESSLLVVLILRPPALMGGATPPGLGGVCNAPRIARRGPGKKGGKFLYKIRDQQEQTLLPDLKNIQKIVLYKKIGWLEEKETSTGAHQWVSKETTLRSSLTRVSLTWTEPFLNKLDFFILYLVLCGASVYLGVRDRVFGHFISSSSSSA